MGGEHTYRFLAEDAGTYWYHSHQVAHRAGRRRAASGRWWSIRPTRAPTADVDRGRRRARLRRRADRQRAARATCGSPAAPGQRGAGPRDQHRQRTRCGSGSGAPFRVLAVDGTDVHGPDRRCADRAVRVPPAAGWTWRSRMPADGSAVRVQLGARHRSLVLGPADAAIRRRRPGGRVVDLLSYGTPAPLGFDPDEAGPAVRATRSAGARASSTGSRASTGRSTAGTSPTCRCSWSPRATSSGCG